MRTEHVELRDHANRILEILSRRLANAAGSSVEQIKSDSRQIEAIHWVLDIEEGQ